MSGTEMIELAAPRTIRRRKRYSKRQTAPQQPNYPAHVRLNGSALRNARTMAGITQCRLAELSRVSNSQIAEYEHRNMLYVHISTASAFAAALGVDVDDIAYIERSHYEQTP